MYHSTHFYNYTRACQKAHFYNFAQAHNLKKTIYSYTHQHIAATMHIHTIPPQPHTFLHLYTGAPTAYFFNYKGIPESILQQLPKLSRRHICMLIHRYTNNFYKLHGHTRKHIFQQLHRHARKQFCRYTLAYQKVCFYSYVCAYHDKAHFFHCTEAHYEVHLCLQLCMWMTDSTFHQLYAYTYTPESTGLHLLHAHLDQPHCSSHACQWVCCTITCKVHGWN